MKNINSARTFKGKFFLAALLFSLLSFSQADSIRVMSYNLMLYPSGTTYSREAYLSYIINEYRPDIFTVCELETSQAANSILTNVLQPINPHYRSAVFEPNHSNVNVPLQQFLYYNAAKLVLHSQTYLTTYIRDINKYTLYLKTDRLATGDTIFVDVYVMHLKASQGQENEQKRDEMVQVLTNHFNSTPPDRYVLVTGDFNFYYHTEPGYNELLDTSNAIVLKDPVHSPGYWHNNSSFAAFHTQSPNRNKGGNFVGGGMDDRFDFILISENLENTANDLYYKPGSYSAFGNNGNCFNDDINDTSCSGYYSQTLRDNLYEMSDHIPVVLTLETTHNIVAVDKSTVKRILLYPNPAGDYLNIKNANNSIFEITDASGKIILENLNGNNEKWYIGHLKPGIYYVRSPDHSFLPVAFIKR
jgi:endonuclease/exonuclease/phosphatase family metal-dependent hydrolase